MLHQMLNLPHALLFVGTDSGEIYQLVSSHLPENQRYKKHHPDIHHYYPEGKSGMHPMESLKELQKDVALVPFEAPYKFFVIHDADRMLLTSANALLKTLEEPPKKTILILQTENEQHLLPTIRSRCQVFRLSKQKQEKDPLENILFEALYHNHEAVKGLENQLEKERKEWEKELSEELPKDLTLIQKESYMKEIEGAVSLRFQNRVFALFEKILIWHRDALAKNLGSPYLLSDRDVPFVPLSTLVEGLKKARLGMMRGMKLSVALEYVIFQLF